MKNIKSKFLCLALSALAFSSLVGCETTNDKTSKKIDESLIYVDSKIGGSENPSISVAPTEDPNKITDMKAEGIVYNKNSKTFTISKAGEFTFTGNFEGNIVVNAKDTDDVKLTLRNFTIVSRKDSPIKCLKANELQISAKKNTQNYVYDYRERQVDENDTQGSAAIYSACDLKITGKGSLVVVGNYNNGIQSKDDLKIKPDSGDSDSIQVKAINNAIKGNDSVTIEDGRIVAISKEGNGISTKNSGTSATKGKQKGTVRIIGGQVDIYAAKDGIDAAYNVEIEKIEEGTDPKVNIYTADFSPYSKDTEKVDRSTLYIKTPSTNAQNNFAVAFKNSQGAVTWRTANVIKMGQKNTRLSVSVPSDAVSLKVCTFAEVKETYNEADAIDKMGDFEPFLDGRDLIELKFANHSITIDEWDIFDEDAEGQKIVDKTLYSSKGIKSQNEVKITAGDIYVQAYDDGITAKYGEALENGASGLGRITIGGGNIVIHSMDDAIHADDILTIENEADIDIVYSHEGLEASTLNIKGGSTKIYATDDGINGARKVNDFPNIYVFDGYLDITVEGVDVDGIDSNGGYYQYGGTVVTKGANRDMATGIDCDGGVEIQGGTLVCFGQPESTPICRTGVQNYVLDGDYQVGEHTIKFSDELEKVTETKYAYSKVFVYSNLTEQIQID